MSYFAQNKKSVIHKTMEMKRILPAFLALMITVAGCGSRRHAAVTPVSGENSSGKPGQVNFNEPSTWLLGYISPAQFTKPPYSDWYLNGFETYVPASDVVEKLKQIDKEDTSIKIVLGTWCPDSRREVPRFMKILDIWEFPAEKVIFIGVDNSKIAPIGGYDTLGIERVPTFIIFKNKIEKGRIIENPVTSLEQDMLNILNRNEE
jgi:thiol-disulfide isomerase/thioredoxin